MPDINPLGELAPKVYEDLAHPALSEIGLTVGRAMKLALSPVNGTLWTIEQALAWLQSEVVRKLSSARTPPEKIVPPPPALLGATIAGIQYVAGEPVLSELFAALLATAMNSDTSTLAHPAFAGMLREMLPDEARVLRSFQLRGHTLSAIPIEVETYTAPDPRRGTAGFQSRDEINIVGIGLERHVDAPVYVMNLMRLGLVERHVIRLDGKRGAPAQELSSKVMGMWALHLSDDSRQIMEVMFPVDSQRTATACTVVTLTLLGRQFAAAVGALPLSVAEDRIMSIAYVTDGPPSGPARSAPSPRSPEGT